MRSLWLRLIVIVVFGMAGCQTTEVSTIPVEEQDPDSAAQINTQLGVAYMQRGDLETALSKLRRALDQDPRNPEAHYAIALLYGQIQETALAEKHYRKAIRLQPRYSDAQNAYGAFLCTEERYEEADPHFQAALQNPLYKGRLTTLVNAGECAYRAGDLNRAEDYLRQALQANPRSARAMLTMAKIAYDSERFMMARAYLQRHHDRARPSPQSLWLGIQLERRLGDKDAEASYALLLRSEFPDSDETRKLLESR